MRVRPCVPWLLRALAAWLVAVTVLADTLCSATCTAFTAWHTILQLTPAGKTSQVVGAYTGEPGEPVWAYRKEDHAKLSTRIAGAAYVNKFFLSKTQSAAGQGISVDGSSVFRDLNGVYQFGVLRQGGADTYEPPAADGAKDATETREDPCARGTGNDEVRADMNVDDEAKDDGAAVTMTDGPDAAADGVEDAEGGQAARKEREKVASILEKRTPEEQRELEEKFNLDGDDSRPAPTASNGAAAQRVRPRVVYVGKASRWPEKRSRGGGGANFGLNLRLREHMIRPEGKVAQLVEDSGFQAGDCVLMRVSYCSDMPGQEDAEALEHQVLMSMKFHSTHANGDAAPTGRFPFLNGNLGVRRGGEESIAELNRALGWSSFEIAADGRSVSGPFPFYQVKNTGTLSQQAASMRCPALRDITIEEKQYEERRKKKIAAEKAEVKKPRAKRRHKAARQPAKTDSANKDKAPTNPSTSRNTADKGLQQAKSDQRRKKQKREADGSTQE